MIIPVAPRIGSCARPRHPWAHGVIVPLRSSRCRHAESKCDGDGCRSDDPLRGHLVPPFLLGASDPCWNQCAPPRATFPVFRDSSLLPGWIVLASKARQRHAATIWKAHRVALPRGQGARHHRSVTQTACLARWTLEPQLHPLELIVARLALGGAAHEGRHVQSSCCRTANCARRNVMPCADRRQGPTPRSTPLARRSPRGRGAWGRRRGGEGRR